MIRLRAALRGRARGDAGLSLVELAVATFVAGVLFAGVGAVFVGTSRAVRAVNVKTSTTADLRIGMEATSRTLRVAYRPAGEPVAITSATGSAVTFYALLNRSNLTTQPLPTLVEYWHDGTCLREAQTPARTLSTPEADGSLYAWDTGRVNKCLLRTTTAPAFSYYTSGTATAAMTSTSTQAERLTIQSVGLTLTVTDPANPTVSGVPASTRLTLSNLG